MKHRDDMHYPTVDEAQLQRRRRRIWKRTRFERAGRGRATKRDSVGVQRWLRSKMGTGVFYLRLVLPGVR